MLSRSSPLYLVKELMETYSDGSKVVSFSQLVFFPHLFIKIVYELEHTSFMSWFERQSET